MSVNGQHPAPDPRTVALGREVERIARRQVSLDQEQAELDGLVRRCWPPPLVRTTASR